MGSVKKAIPFFLVLALSAPFFSAYQLFSISDSEDMLNLSVSIYELGDLSSAVKTNLVTGEVVRIYSKYGVGLPFLMVPFLFLYDLLSALVIVPPDLILGAVNILLLALTASVLHSIIVELGFSNRRALFLSVASVFGTFAFVYMNNFLSEPLQGLLLTSAFLFLIKSGSRPRLYAVLAGLSLSAAVFTKAANIALLPFFIAYCLYRSLKEKDHILRPLSFFTPLALSGALMIWLNLSRYGSPFDFGYGSEAGMFVNPVLKGVKDLLINPGKGILIYAPAMLLFPYAVWRLSIRKKAEALLILSLFAANFLLYSAWWAWEGADTWGPRFLLPLIPLAIAPLAALPASAIFKAALPALFAAGFIVNLGGVLVDSSAYNYMVLESTRNIELKTARPQRDYLESNGRLQPPPYVVTTELPEFNVLSGHLWVLRARSGADLFNTPPWLTAYPALKTPPIESLPDEVRREKSPSSPYYYDAYTLQASKAGALGKHKAAERLVEKAERGIEGKRLRLKQMSY